MRTGVRDADGVSHNFHNFAVRGRKPGNTRAIVRACVGRSFAGAPGSNAQT
jgi:hypothetical protein